METKKKEVFIAGAFLLFLGIILIVTAFEQGILSSGKIIGIFGLFSSLAGIGSFLNPNIAEVVLHWFKGIQKTNEIRVSQHQNKSINSPQTSMVQGNQYIHYGKEGEEKQQKDNKYNKDKVQKRLLEIKSKLINLTTLNHKEGNKIFSPLKKEVKGIIQRVYLNNAKESEKRLIHNVFWIITSSTQESDYQNWYAEDVEGLIATINIILREMELE